MPSELWQRIEEYTIIFDKEHSSDIQRPITHVADDAKRPIYCLSLVSKKMAQIMRPLLFRTLHLERPADIRFLSEVFRSTMCPVSPDAVHSLPIDPYRPEQMSMLRGSTLFHWLGSLIQLSYSCRSRNPELVAIELRARFSHLKVLRQLELSNVTLPSFSAFARLISAIPSLQGLKMNKVEWRSTGLPRPTQLLDCNSGFSCLRDVSCYNGTASWPFAWLFAAAATGYAYRRTTARARGAVPEVVPPDIAHIVSTANNIEEHVDYALDWHSVYSYKRGTLII